MPQALFYSVDFLTSQNCYPMPLAYALESMTILALFSPTPCTLYLVQPFFEPLANSIIETL